MVCKLSIVIPGAPQGGAIIDVSAIPQVGDQIQMGNSRVEVIEVMELLPPRGDFHFVHATCRLVPEAGAPAAGQEAPDHNGQPA